VQLCSGANIGKVVVVEGSDKVVEVYYGEGIAIDRGKITGNSSYFERCNFLKIGSTCVTLLCQCHVTLVNHNVTSGFLLSFSQVFFAFCHAFCYFFN